MEYVPGAGSAVYGSNALFGVINIITKRERGPARIRVGTEVGAYHTKMASLSLRGGDDNYYYGASLVLQDSAGYSISTTDTTRDKDGYERIVFSKQLGFGGETMGVDANFRYVKANSQIDSGFTPTSRFPTRSRILSIDSWTVGRDRANLLDLPSLCPTLWGEVATDGWG